MIDDRLRGDPVALLKHFISIRSDTDTPLEVDMERAILEYIWGIPRFRENGTFGVEDLPGDEHGRGVVWALLRGDGADRPGGAGSGRPAVVFLNHHDVVDTFDYGRLQPLALNPDELRARLTALAEKGELILDGDVIEDLRSGKWLFGRGGCDMKSGTVVQLAALERLAEEAGAPLIDVLFLSVPDEENVSRGMRHGVSLLGKLKERYGLDYQVLIDSEAHERNSAGDPAFYDGSIGKTMLAVYVKGVKSHLGDIARGLNPSLILSNLVRTTEIDRDLVETEGGVRSPPPSWSFVRDFKECYDASIPEAAGGYISFLPMVRKPAEILEYMRVKCESAVEESLARYRDAFRGDDGGRPAAFYRQGRVLLFGELLADALSHDPEGTGQALDAARRECREALAGGASSLPECNFRIIKTLLEHVPYGGPVVVAALSPPYYPNISNQHLEGVGPGKKRLAERLPDLVRAAGAKVYSRRMERKPYFMGISDLSYAAFLDGAAIACLRDNMPLLQAGIYDLPFEDMARTAMPILNIGAWGKDPHKFTERVYIPDVAEALPALYVELIRAIGEHIES